MRILIVVVILAAIVATAGASNGTGSEVPQPLSETGAGNWAVVTVPATFDGPPPTRPMPRAAGDKMDSAVAKLSKLEGRDREQARQTAESVGARLESDRVQLQVVAEAGQESAAALAVSDRGGEVTGEYEEVLQAWLAPEQISSLAAVESVSYIRLPDQVVPAEFDLATTLSEGVSVANADAWHKAAYQGQGVRIAIIDAGFQGYTTKLGVELPATVTVKNFVDGQGDGAVDGTTRHGTACAEIIHDMAPQAQLYLLKIATDIDLSEAVNYAINQGVDIISTSITFLNATPGDGTGKFAGMARAARNAGILWVTAAGNYRETHWAGTFSDPDNDSYLNFGPNQEVNFFGPGDGRAFLIPAGYAIQASIRWDDWSAVNQDYSLYLVRYNGSTFDIVASSQNPQSGQAGQRPTERASVVTFGSAAVYGVVIQHISGNRDAFFNLFTPNRELDRRVEVLSLGNLADVTEVLTVAAITVQPPYNQEFYSSEGPTNGPGGSPNGGRRKPDLAAFANVSTVSYGVRGFNGTSAATPHVAGAAALVLSAYPALSPNDIQAHLETKAIDQGVTGPDVEYGYGRLNMGPPPQPIILTDFVFLPFVSAGNRP